MKVLHTADLHIGNNRFSPPHDQRARFRDRVAFMRRFTKAAADVGADLAIVSGDVFDNRVPKPHEWEALLAFIEGVTDVCPLVIADGNHDGRAVINDPSSRVHAPLSRIRDRRLYVPTEPGHFDVGDLCRVVYAPYAHKRACRDCGNNVDIASLYTKAADGMGLADGGRPLILVYHGTVDGATVGVEHEYRLEEDVLTSPKVIDLFDYAALGHVHKYQRVGEKGWYPGSPVRTDFGEAEYAPSYLLAEVHAGRNPVVALLDAHDRPMVTGYIHDLAGPFEGAIIRLDAATPMEAAKGASELYAQGAMYVEARVDSLPPEASRRAISMELEPIAACAKWLEENIEDEAARADYLKGAQEIMRSTEVPF